MTLLVPYLLCGKNIPLLLKSGIQLSVSCTQYIISINTLSSVNLQKMGLQEKLNILKSNIKSYPDFPKKGILFWDLFSVLGNSESFKILMDLLLDHVKTITKPINAVVGLESRGFLIGPHIALHLNVPFVPIRKKGKLPGNLARVDYSLEYGSDTFEVQRDSLQSGQSVLIVDDLLATGGSLEATCRLMEQLKIDITELFVVIEITELKGRDKLKYPVHSLVKV